MQKVDFEMNNWEYLDDGQFLKRQEIVAKHFQSEKIIIEIGSTDRKLRNAFGEEFSGRIISVDPLLKETVYHNNGDIQFSGKLTQCIKFLLDSEINPDSLVALGLNIAPMGARYQDQVDEYLALIELASKLNRIAIEFPVRFFPARVESELAISLLLPKIEMDEVFDYENSNVPFHASRRRMVIGKPTNSPTSQEILEYFNSFRINSHDTEVDSASWTIRKDVEIAGNGKTISAKVFKKFFILAIGKKWSYIASFENIVGMPVGIRAIGYKSNLTISSATKDLQIIIFEKRLPSGSKLGIISYFAGGEKSLIRFGEKGGVRLFVLDVYLPT